MHKNIYHHFLSICNNYKINFLGYSDISVVKEKKTDDSPMYYISHNTPLLLPMGLLLLWPYTARRLGTLPSDGLSFDMLYTKHVHVFPFPSLSMIIGFSVYPIVTVLMPYLCHLLHEMLPISSWFLMLLVEMWPYVVLTDSECVTIALL